MLRRIGSVCALATLLAMSACSADSGLPKNAAFGGPGGTTAQQGIVVVGIRVVRPPTEHSFLVGDYDSAAWFLMTFRGVDESNRFTRVTRSVQLCNQTESLMGMARICDPTIMAHRVLELPPGRYVLSDFEVHEYKMTLTTSFAGGPEGSNVTGFHQPPPGVHSLIAFDAAPGTITYIGDFSWDPGSFPARCVVTRDDLGARSALADYPLIQGPMVFQTPRSIAVAAYPKS
ncbi:hypothetical protein [Acidisoma sp. 7E03]